jgi:hypothetical protein
MFTARRPGFQFKETMRGSYHLLADPADERAIEFTIVSKAKDLRRFARDKTCAIEGDVQVEKLASKRPLSGTLGLLLLDERRLPYRFTFTGDDDKTYELRGQKDWTPMAPIDSMTTLPASIYDELGEEIGRATLRFDLRHDLAKFLRSWKLKLF